MRISCYQRFVALVLASLVALLHCSSVGAAAVPVTYSGKMNGAVGGVISQKVGRWGFAANDPRFGATLDGVGAGVTALAVGVAAGGVAAVGWPVLLIGAGVSALVTGAISLAQDGLYKWLFSSDGTISTKGTPVGSTSSDAGQYAAMIMGGAYYSAGCNGFSIKGGGAGGVIASYMACAYPGWRWAMTSEDSTGQWFYYDNPAGNGNYVHWGYSFVPKSSTGAPSSCDIGQVYTGGKCVPAFGYVAPVTDLTGADVPAAIAAMPQAETAKPVSNEMLAAAANSAWQAMPASPNSFPWSASDPITPADVGQWKAANPSSIPTVGDFLGPVASAGSTSVDVGTGVTGQTAGPAASPGEGTKVDLGPDPNFPPPTLEGTPTAQQILAPLLNLMPDLKGFAVPSHTASCPRFSLVALGGTYALDSHCQLIESNRSLIEAAMLLCWTLSSVFIVLKA